MDTARTTARPSGLSSMAVELSNKYDNLFKEIIGAGWTNSSDGSVEAPTGYFAKIEVPSRKGEREEMRDMLAHHDGAEHLQKLFDELDAGWYLTVEDNNGLIWVWHDPVSGHLWYAYQQLENDYGLWLEEDDLDADS